MPQIKSKRQFRYMQAVAHGSATKKGGPSVKQALQGIAEMRASYKALPESAKKGKGKR